MAELQTFNETVLTQPGKLLVKFGAPWCAPCKSVAPTLEEMVKEGYNVFDVNTDEDQESAVKYNIRSVPTFMVFEGGEVVNTATGAQTKSQLISLLEGK